MRWGFVGASRIGHSRLAGAIREAGGTLVSVAARDPERARSYAADLGFARADASYDALLEAPDIEAVYIGLTNDQHVPWALRALEAGKHVLCEKPLALHASEVALLQAAQARSGRQVMEAFVHPYHPQFDLARQQIRSGALGELRSGHAEFSFVLNHPGDYRWNAAMGGGALLDVGCYAVSALRLLSGQSVRRVFAHAHWAPTEDSAGAVDGTLSALLDFGDWSATLSCGFENSGTQSLELAGSQGRLRLETPFSAVEQPTRMWLLDQEHTFDPVNPYVAMVQDFMQACQSGRPSQVPLSDSLLQSQVLDALLLSARTRQPVDLNPA